MSFAIWQAAVSAGATLDELQKLEDGGYKRAFLAKLVAWYNMRNLIDLHTNDAQNAETKRRSKR